MNAFPMQPSHINVGTGQDVTIAELAGLIAQVTGFSGSILFDPSKPDSTPRKLMDVRIWIGARKSKLEKVCKMRIVGIRHQ